MTTLREKILSSDNLPKEQVTLKGYGDAVVEVRGLTTGQRLRLVKGATVDGEVDMVKLMPELVIATTYDPADGTPVFTAADREAVEGTSALALDELFTAALRINGFDATEKIAKNSETSPTSSTPSA